MITKYTFTTMRPDFNPVERDNFKDAFTDMFNWVQQQLSMSLMEFETAIWIEISNDRPLFIYNATTLAHEQGILTPEGKLA